jgi:hypothetical protein
MTSSQESRTPAARTTAANARTNELSEMLPMNVITVRGRGKVHRRAAGAVGVMPLCMPYGGNGTSAYRTTPLDVTCASCLAQPAAPVAEPGDDPEPPTSVIDLRDVVVVTRETAQSALYAERSAQTAVRHTTPGTSTHTIAQSALIAASAARKPAERAWHAAVAAFIVVARAERAAGARFPLDDVETNWAKVPEVAALIAAHEAN